MHVFRFRLRLFPEEVAKASQFSHLFIRQPINAHTAGAQAFVMDHT
jgi:hypothetical protein